MRANALEDLLCRQGALWVRIVFLADGKNLFAQPLIDVSLKRIQALSDSIAGRDTESGVDKALNALEIA